jgi:hypothetical protein
VTSRPRGGQFKIPDQISQMVQIRFDPRIYKEVKMAALREGFETPAHWLHQHLCSHLEREDLLIRESRRPQSASA